MEPAPAPAPAQPKAQVPPPAIEKERPKEADKPKEPEKAVIAAEPEVKPAPPAPSPVAEETAAAAPAKNHKKLRLTVAAAIGMLVLVGGLVVVYPMLHRAVSPRTGSAQQDSSDLALRVERTTGGIQLTWNRDLAAIQTASKVVLSITDGDRHENIELDPNQVRNGGFVYSPISGDISFQMEVTDAHQTKTTSQSLLFHDPRPSPLAEPPTDSAKQPASAKNGSPSTTTAQPTSTPASASTPSASESTSAADSSEEAAPSRSTTPLKRFNTQTLAERLRPVSQPQLALPDAPAVSRASNPTPGSLAGIVPASPALPPPPKPAAPAPAPPPVTGGQILPAQVISRVDPIYPRFAQQSGAAGLVELEATITAEGTVKNPHVIHGNVMLHKAAMDAVLQWRYKPAMLNGKPVESPVDIKLNFVASR